MKHQIGVLMVMDLTGINKMMELILLGLFGIWLTYVVIKEGIRL